MGTVSAGERPLPANGAPTLRWEKLAWNAGKLTVAGVDEVGRGAWAGPLVAAALILPHNPRARARITRSINQAGTVVRDSKQLTADQRRRVFDVLQLAGVVHSIAVIDVDEIDTIGLGAANRLALCRAVRALTPEPEHVLVDAYRVDELPCTHEAIVHGDNLSQSIAMASIVAKLHRDALMAALDDEHPEHGFAAHKGYGTLAHRAALERHGITPQHRRSFAPIAQMLSHVPHD